MKEKSMIILKCGNNLIFKIRNNKSHKVSGHGHRLFIMIPNVVIRSLPAKNRKNIIFLFRYEFTNLAFLIK
jgi:hypothetical protein